MPESPEQHSVKVPTAAEALLRIAWILATPEWSVGMLEDIAAICEQAGFVVPEHQNYEHH